LAGQAKPLVPNVGRHLSSSACTFPLLIDEAVGDFSWGFNQHCAEGWALSQFSHQRW